MPLFDFKCLNCDRVEEKLVKDKEAIVTCPVCQNEMTRLLSAPYGRILGYGYANGYSKPK
jgi:putative FmdB family regulatory protein